MRNYRNLADIAGSVFAFESHLGVASASNLCTGWTDTLTGSALVAAQGTPTKQPAYTASNANFQGYPTIDWPLARVADQIYLETAVFASSIAKTLTFIAAIRCTDISVGRIIMNNRFPTTFNANMVIPAGNVGVIRLTGSGAPAMNSVNGAIRVNETCVVVGLFNSMGRVFVNGKFCGTGTLGVNNMDALRIGNTGFDTGSLPFVGAMAAIGGWTRELGMGEIQRATTMLLRRYNPSLLASRTAKTRTVLPAPGLVGGRSRIL